MVYIYIYIYMFNISLYILSPLTILSIFSLHIWEEGGDELKSREIQVPQNHYKRFCLLIFGQVIPLKEKAMAPHSSTLAWKISWTKEPGRLQSMGSERVGRDWMTSLSLFTFMHWRRKWQPTSVFLPGESQGRGSLVGCSLWGHRVGHNWSDLAATAAIPLKNKQI